MGYTRVSYEILCNIYRDKMFSSQALYNRLEREQNADLIYKIVLGVLDHDIELEYIISCLCKKSPQNAVKIILKQAIYCIKYLDGVPDYAVLNNHVELTKKIGKKQVSGFVNAVLKKVVKGDYQMPDKSDKIKYYSVIYSKPEWLVKKLIKDFGEDSAINIMSAEPYDLTHIRVNSIKYSNAKFEAFLHENEIEFIKSEVGGYFCKINKKIKNLFREGYITYQSVTSMVAVNALDVKDRTNVLDICSAPGGKAVLIAEQNLKSKILACDIYPHRVNLINSYRKRMGVKNVETKIMDATEFIPEMVEKFDRVLVDAPCSALGIIRKQPDILLNRCENDILTLTALQTEILQNASKYLRKDGILVYSTCTITKEENYGVVEKFLVKNPEFKLHKIDIDFKNDGTIQFLPEGAIDGFFIAKLRKI